MDPKILVQGLQDAMAGGKVLLTDDQIKTVMTDLKNQVRQEQEAKRLAAAPTNKKEGAAFLAANATKPGVVTLPSGLEYKILVAGTGPSLPPTTKWFATIAECCSTIRNLTALTRAVDRRLFRSPE